MLDYFQTGAFLGASKETTLRRAFKATSFGISGLTTFAQRVGQDSITDPSARRQFLAVALWSIGKSEAG